MRYRFGRLLQILGMLIAPIGMAGNIMNKAEVTEKHVLATAIVGLTIFFVGRALQGPVEGGG